MKPFSPACERNRVPILSELERLLGVSSGRILEIGSGTGQHAVYFAARLSGWTWQTSDLAENHAGINAWLMDAGLPNLLSPVLLDVDGAWPCSRFDAVFTANTLHIISEEQGYHLLEGAANLLEEGAPLIVYGPFTYGGRHTSESNIRFEGWLRDRDPRSGVRDLEVLKGVAADLGLCFEEDVAMPANNRLIVWRREAAQR